MKNILRVTELSKHFGGNYALDGATITLKPNKINLLIGANGSGKTTLINTLFGNLRADGGNVTLYGEDVTRFTPDKIFQTGTIRTFQSPRLFENLSVLENLLILDSANDMFRYALDSRHWKDSENKAVKKALGILESLSLLDHRNKNAYDMSGGQIKLLELGKTMMCDVELVMLDEPIAGVAPKLAHQIFERIAMTVRDAETTFFIIEHRLDIALQYADHVFVMDKGKIIADDLPDRILSHTKVQESYLGK